MKPSRVVLFVMRGTLRVPLHFFKPGRLAVWRVFDFVKEGKDISHRRDIQRCITRAQFSIRDPRIETCKHCLSFGSLWPAHPLFMVNP